MKFYLSDLALDPMTVVLNLNLDIVKMYAYIENKKHFCKKRTASLQIVHASEATTSYWSWGGGQGWGVPCTMSGRAGAMARGLYSDVQCIMGNGYWLHGAPYEQTDRHALLKNYLPATSLAGGNKVPSFSSPKVIA